MKDKLLIITNESISESGNEYFCNNLDIKSIPEGLNKLFDVDLLGRISKKKKYHKINNIKTYASKNIISFIKKIITANKKNFNTKNLIISINPFTFIASIVLFFLKKKPIVYLRSNGYQEYKSILGILGPFIYHVMFITISKIAIFISCRKHLLKNVSGEIVTPSHLSQKWLKNHKPTSLKKNKLLYVGRIKVEKGIFSLIKIIDGIKNLSLTIISSKELHYKIKEDPKIYLIGSLSSDELIDQYDKSDIFILPSFTEGHPQVLDEALSRLRPVIVFREISHVTREREGIFVCERNKNSLEKTIKNITENYLQIQSKIKSMIYDLPTEKIFMKQLEKHIKKKY